MSPDEAVAIGASIQAILATLNEEDQVGERHLPSEVRAEFSDDSGGLIKVTNITTHTLGVVLWDDTRIEEYVFPMIQKMTPIPAEIHNSFGTAKANLKNVMVRVVEGESTVPGECMPLGSCEIELPPYLPKGSLVELTYHYDVNQVLEVTVAAYGKQNRVSISRNTGLTESEMVSATADLSRLRIQ